MPEKPKRPEPPEVPAARERRKDPRYKFTAAVEVEEKESGRQIESRVSDLGPRGCFVTLPEPFPLGTIVTLRITKDAQPFEADARVVSSAEGRGMGLFFTNVQPGQLEILATWLSSSLETSWLASTRRQSQRVLVRVPVVVSGQNTFGSPFHETTYTHAISAHGALILLSATVKKGQHLTLSNERTKGSLECVVAHIGQPQSDLVQVGVAFTLPNPGFWNVTFPPEDWTVRHPDAKSKANVRPK